MNIYSIYKTLNKINGKIYIGFDSNWPRRKLEHKSHSKDNCETQILHKAIKKYGWDNLIKEVVLIADEVYCLDIENKLRPNDKIGWNIVMGGGKPPSALGKKFVRSEEYKEKQRLAHIGRKSWNAGIKLTAEQKIKQFNLAEYMKDKVSPMKGKKHSEETKEKIRQTKLSQSRSKQCLA